MSSTTATLFDRLGGQDAVKAAVEEFYKRLLEDSELETFFVNVKMSALKIHQLQFFKVAFSKIPDDLDVPRMLLEKHKRLFVNMDLNEHHFDLVAGHFVATLENLEIQPSLIDEAVAVIGPLRQVFEDGRTVYKDEVKASDQKVLRPHNDDSKQATLLDRLGGNDAVKAAVDGLYQRLLDDPETSPFFETTDMARLKQHQLAFMKVAFSQIPEGLDVLGMMKDKHARLFREMGLNEKHFDLVAGHFVDTLQSLSVSQELIDAAVGVIGPLRVAFEDGAKNAASEVM
jgi:hemoglobin